MTENTLQTGGFFVKRRKALSLLLTLAMILAALPADIITVSAQEGGETTADLMIDTLEKLEQFREEVNKGEDFEGKIIQLTADIDLSEKYGAEKGAGGEDVSWTPIGKDYIDSFAGTFDGGGHEISGLYINDTDDYQGLFGYNDGTIKDLNVSGAVAGGDDVGGITGYNDGTIENVCNTGDISGSGDYIYVGGITGDNGSSDSIIENSYNTGKISTFGESRSVYIGGVAGKGDGTIKKVMTQERSMVPGNLSV